jgi:hypothetical protein
VTADAAARGRDPKRCGFVLISTFLRSAMANPGDAGFAAALLARQPRRVVLTGIEVDQPSC